MRRLLLPIAVAVVLAGLAGTAAADPIGDYRRNGSIDPCKYSPAQLKKELGNLPPDVKQYAPGLADQLSQGRSGCNSGGSDTRNTQDVPGPSNPGNGDDGGNAGRGGAAGAGAGVPDPPAPTPQSRRRLASLTTPAITSSMDQGAPGWVVPAVIGALVLALLVALLRMTGIGTGRLAPLGSAFSEAGARTGEAMTQLWDRVRLGR